MSEEGLSVTLEIEKGYGFLVDFHQEGLTPFLVDEPPPLGEGRGPSAARMLAAAVGHCLSALYCLRKARIPVTGMQTVVEGSFMRNERGRLRIGGIKVTIQPKVSAEDQDRMGRCLELFEDFCVVTQSVRGGIAVNVDVVPVSA